MASSEYISVNLCIPCAGKVNACPRVVGTHAVCLCLFSGRNEPLTLRAPPTQLAGVLCVDCDQWRCWKVCILLAVGNCTPFAFMKLQVHIWTTEDHG